ncbi:MAG: hypothetical protein HZA93_26700 [Verrucomicrobia bacterium]|nr:hypothetical protein [Verrucomicrobiota bacterium]
MTFAEAVAIFTAQLRANPAAPRPPFRTETVEQMRESKMLDRAFDQAQMDLGLVTPSEMQRINSAFAPVDHSVAHRVVRYPQYV